MQLAAIHSPLRSAHNRHFTRSILVRAGRLQSPPMIDLYSDTMTKPTPGMRRAMAEAEVADEQQREDPTTNRLQERVAELLGKESAVFLPSGTMCNAVAVKTHCAPGEAIIADRLAHVM